MNRRYNAFASSPMVWLIVFSAALFFASPASAVNPPPALDPGTTLYNPSPNPAFNIFGANRYASAPLPANFSEFWFAQTFPHNYNGTNNTAPPARQKRGMARP
jgi:hypothetical protein